MPLFHPNCRGTMAAAMKERCESLLELNKKINGGGKRAARDGDDGKTYHVPADMTYKEWEEKFVSGCDKGDLDVINDGEMLQYKRKKHGYEDITGHWYPDATPGSHIVEDADEVTVKGVTYKVDGRYVQLDYSPHEKEIAELLEREVGGELKMLPKVNIPQNVRTADFLYNGHFYELKLQSQIGGQVS